MTNITLVLYFLNLLNHFLVVAIVNKKRRKDDDEIKKKYLQIKLKDRLLVESQYSLYLLQVEMNQDL